MRGLFVTGTDTEVGKTVLAASICAALAARGERVAAFKPAVTGTDEPPAAGWPADHVLLAEAASAGQSPDEVAPYSFGPPLSPHFAAELAGDSIDPDRLRTSARAAASVGRAVDGERLEGEAGASEGEAGASEGAADSPEGTAGALVCEGVGGLLVPLTDDYLVRDLAVDLGLPLVIAARTGLGTINHTLLTVAAARSAGLDVAGIVMTPWPPEPAPIELSNRDTVARLSGIAVTGLPPATPATLAAAGAALPLDDWL